MQYFPSMNIYFIAIFEYSRCSYKSILYIVNSIYTVSFSVNNVIFFICHDFSIFYEIVF